jgi:hypothetical protein
MFNFGIEMEGLRYSLLRQLDVVNFKILSVPRSTKVDEEDFCQAGCCFEAVYQAQGWYGACRGHLNLH